jgi:hypothetical protein
MRRTPEEWATERLKLARRACLMPGTDRRLKTGQKLGPDYQAARMPIVRQRLCQAGLRLVLVLNEAFGEPQPAD